MSVEREEEQKQEKRGMAEIGEWTDKESAMDQSQGAEEPEEKQRCQQGHSGSDQAPVARGP